MKNTKRLLTVFFVLLLLFSTIAGAVEPRWVNIRRTFVQHIYIDGGVNCAVQITGVYEVSHINNIDIVFERYLGNDEWEEVASWTDLSTTNYMFNFSEDVPNIPRGYTYRLRVTADVYKDGICESLDEDYQATY